MNSFWKILPIIDKILKSKVIFLKKKVKMYKNIQHKVFNLLVSVPEPPYYIVHDHQF